MDMAMIKVGLGDLRGCFQPKGFDTSIWKPPGKGLDELDVV